MRCRWSSSALLLPPPPPPPLPTYYPDGTKVLVTELKSRPELNGTTGTIIGFNVEKARYEVRLPSGGRLVFSIVCHCVASSFCRLASPGRICRAAF